MTVDEQCVFGAVPRLELGDHVLDVAVVMGNAVDEGEVERSPGLLNVDGDLVDGFGLLLEGAQLTL